jgi:hypothetical protein
MASKYMDGSQKTATLEALLNAGTFIRFSRRHRYRMALTLASSFLQLQSTPWAGSSFSTQEVFFFGEMTKFSPFESTLFPFLMFDPRQQDVPEFSNRLQSLGVTLLELGFGSTLESSPFWKGLEHTVEIDRNMVYEIAEQWNAHMMEEAGHKYADAVSWCFHAEPKDEDITEEFCSSVIEPLQSTLTELLGPTAL